MMSGHTPGPWQTDGDQIWAEEAGRLRDYVGTTKLHNPARAENARLMAAAPDLLAGLEGLLNEDGHAFSCLAGVRVSLTCTAECRTAIAAIKAARGLEDS